MQSGFFKLAVLGGAFALSGAVAASAATILNDTFSSDTVGSAPANYTVVGTPTLNTVNDGNSLSTGGGNALSVTLAGASGRAARAFTQTTINDGEALTLSFDVRLAAPTTVASTDRLFRFGLYNSTANNVGFTGRMDTGTNGGNVYDLFRSVAAFDVTAANGSGQLLFGTEQDGALGDNNVRHVTVTIARSGNTANTSYSVTNGSTTVSAQVNGAVSTTVDPTYFSPNLFQIGFNSGATSGEEFRVDNISITTASTPEPTSLAVLGLAGVGMLARRRK